MNTYVFKKGDTLRVIDAGASNKISNGELVICASDVNTDDGYETIDIEKNGNTSNYRGFYVRRFELVNGKAFKAGDKVTLLKQANYGRLSVGESYVIESTNGQNNRYLKFVDNDYDSYEAENFELAVPRAPKLKLPLPVTRASGTKLVLVAGTKPGFVTLIYGDDGRVLVDEYSEERVLEKFKEGMWEVTGAKPAAGLSQAVTDAKAALATAEAAVVTAQQAVYDAEVALTNNKPYLA